MELDNYDLDLARLSELFPIEVWSILFKRITDHEVLENLGNSSSVFRNLLLTRRTMYLFEKIWDLMEYRIAQRVEVTAAEDAMVTRPTSATDLCTDCGRVRKTGRHKFSSVLSMRAVCKTWKDSIDSYYIYKQCWDQEYRWTTGLTTGASAGAMLNHFAKTHQGDNNKLSKNPFVGGSVELVLQIDAQRPHVFQMLNVYGMHVKDCHVMDNDGIINEQFVLQLSEWLNLMPCLFTLKISFNEEIELDSAELNRLLAQSPCRPFFNILRMEFAQAPAAVFNHLIQINNGVRLLRIEGMAEIASVDVDAFNSLELDSFQYICCNEEQYLFLESVQPNVFKKSVELVFDCEYIPWQKVFTLMEEKFSTGSAISDLFVQMPSPDTREQTMELFATIENMRLNLSNNITSIELLLETMSTLDFLLPMKDSLEYIHVEIDYHATDYESIDLVNQLVSRQVVKVVDYQYRLCESNVWELFPKLERFLYSFRFSVSTNMSIDDAKIPNWIKASSEDQASCDRRDYNICIIQQEQAKKSVSTLLHVLND